MDCWVAQVGACSLACSGANELVPIGQPHCMRWPTDLGAEVSHHHVTVGSTATTGEAANWQLS